MGASETLLEPEPAHGYTIKRRYDERFARARPLAFGQVYASLAGFEKRGWAWAPRGGGRRGSAAEALGLNRRFLRDMPMCGPSVTAVDLSDAPSILCLWSRS
jgi:hypothetical protein